MAIKRSTVPSPRSVHIAPGVLAVFALVAVLGLVNITDAAMIRIVDVSTSQTAARDGQTLTLNYRISSTVSTQAWLGCTLTGPSGEIIEDDTHEGPEYEITLSSGEHSYQRDFFVNMPPGTGTGAYDVAWGVDWGTGFASVTRTDALTILPPIQVRVPILMYHKVGPIAYSEYWVTTDRFGAQMRALKAYGYTAVTLQDIMDYRAGIKSPPAKPIVITFDDAYRNNLTNAYPQMESAGVETATIFVPTGRIGGDNSWDGSDDNPVIPHMTWDDLRYLDDTGRIDFESHTVTHPYLRSLGTQALNRELMDSASAFESELGYRPKFISWPYGQTNLKIDSAGRMADYFAAVLSWGGVETTCANKWELRRVYIDWNASVDYDAAHPENFLPNLVEENVPIPAITINSITYLDASTGQSLADNQTYRCSKVKVRVRATNSGKTNQIVATLYLDGDTDHGNGVAFDSHAARQDVTVDFAPGTKDYEWTWQIPPDASLGRYYASVAFHDAHYVLGFAYSNPLWREAFSVIPLPIEQIKTIRDTKALPNGAETAWIRAVVSAAFPSTFYLESDDRAIGIRVETDDYEVFPGDVALAMGTMQTNSYGERYIEASALYKDGTGSVRPVGMTNGSLGGSDWRYNPATGAGQRGVYQGNGTNNTGLLITVWGKITGIGSSYFYIDDGTGLQDGTTTNGKKNIGIRITCDPRGHVSGEYVIVTGICTPFKASDGRIVRRVWARGTEDIVVRYHP